MGFSAPDLPSTPPFMDNPSTLRASTGLATRIPSIFATELPSTVPLEEVSIERTFPRDTRSEAPPTIPSSSNFHSSSPNNPHQKLLSTQHHPNTNRHASTRAHQRNGTNEMSKTRAPFSNPLSVQLCPLPAFMPYPKRPTKSAAPRTRRPNDASIQFTNARHSSAQESPSPSPSPRLASPRLNSPQLASRCSVRIRGVEIGLFRGAPHRSPRSSTAFGSAGAGAGAGSSSNSRAPGPRIYRHFANLVLWAAACASRASFSGAPLPSPPLLSRGRFVTRTTFSRCRTRPPHRDRPRRYKNRRLFFVLLGRR